MDWLHSRHCDPIIAGNSNNDCCVPLMGGHEIVRAGSLSLGHLMELSRRYR